MKEVIVVGAGPIGSYLAGLLEDLDVLVLEKKKEVGNKSCSGLVSKDFGKLVDVKDVVEHEMGSCILHSTGKEVKLGIKQGVYVIDRDKFDKKLAEKVKDKIEFECGVEDVKIGDHVEVVTNKGVFKSKLLVGCDGCGSVVRNNFGIIPKDVVNGLVAYVNQKDFSDSFEVWFDKKIIKDGFLWKIPRGNRLEYGMMGTGVKFEQLERFFKLDKYQKLAAPIPIGFQKSFFKRCLLIGDAASQIKPWSGGGLLYGLKCAKIAAQIVLEAFEKQDFSEQFLEKYQDLWKKEIGGGIRKGLIFRKLFKAMGNFGIDQAFKLAQISGFKEFDMDKPFGFLKI